MNKSKKQKFWYGYRKEAMEVFKATLTQIDHWAMYPDANPQFTYWAKQRAEEKRKERITIAINKLFL